MKIDSQKSRGCMKIKKTFFRLIKVREAGMGVKQGEEVNFYASYCNLDVFFVNVS